MYPLARGQDSSPEAKKKASVWMKAKLDYSRAILEGLTEADYDKIYDNAKALNVSSFFEILFRGDRPEYRQQVTQFVHANQDLMNHAKKKNIYGATLAYNQLMLSCVRCHMVVREAQGKK